MSRARVGMVLLCLAAGVGILWAQVKPAAPMVSSGPGRFVIVNPSPDSVRYIMLLDAQTGVTWQMCTVTEAKPQAWCMMAPTLKP